MMITHNLENWTEHKKYTTIEKRLNSENIALLSEINCRSDMGVTQLIGNRYQGGIYGGINIGDVVYFVVLGKHILQLGL